MGLMFSVPRLVLGPFPWVLFFFPDLVFSVPGISSDSGIPKNSRVSKMKVPEVLIDFAASEKKGFPHRHSYN